MSISLEQTNQTIRQFTRLIEEKKATSYEGPLKVGVDLGTANIVLSVLDQHNQPVAGASYPASVVKDGLVVDYVGAVHIVKELKRQVEEILGLELTHAATAVPPGTMGGNAKAIANVVESAGMDIVHVVDEPTAAASLMGISDGAVVDVGGGTTGISILRNGEVIFTADEPTGGTHMSLVVAGHYKTSFEEAEILKKDLSRQADIFTIVKPVVEKMASIVKRQLIGFDVNTLYVVGGACCFPEFEQVFFKETGVVTVKPENPLFITPLGIAMYGER